MPSTSPDDNMFVYTYRLSRESTYSDHPRRFFCACVMNGWCLLGKTNERIFMFWFVLVHCGLAHRVNVHASRYDIWRLHGFQVYKKKLRQLALHKQRGLWVPRRRALCHICHACLCSRDDASETIHRTYPTPVSYTHLTLPTIYSV